ncbi:lytic transglycosylase domain-containing protein [Candidatus Marithrix sp. Canyon 246]|uniref:lytic transglycosylase domain-containing protein n=1 Tax=Candidatus Marithrix sp. Canyon 246 TaxID=1827136 RepID=UPI00084A061E|nr:lytic transglycosylase domain-containing protein [Candidatus Marithrix sp. Canyon 246]
MSKKAVFSVVMVMSISACSNMPKSNDLNVSNNSEQKKVENLAFHIHELDTIASSLNKDTPAWVALDWNQIQTQTIAQNRYKKPHRRVNVASIRNRYNYQKPIKPVGLASKHAIQSNGKFRYVSKPRLSSLIRSSKVRGRYKRYNKMIRVVAKSVGIEPAFLHAIVRAESNYNPKARSHVGAAGFTQLMPGTAREMGVKNRYNPVANLYGGARYLRYLLKFFNKNRKLAIAGYNAGPFAVKRHGYKVPPYRETRNYVKKVLSYYKRNKKYFKHEVAYKKMLENSRRYQ